MVGRTCGGDLARWREAASGFEDQVRQSEFWDMRVPDPGGWYGETPQASTCLKRSKWPILCRPPPLMAGLDLHEDVRFQWMTWRVQRAGWLLFAAIVAAAVCGVLGDTDYPGVKTEAPGMELTYPQFVRRGRLFEMRAQITPLGSGAPELRFSRELFEKMQLERMSPSPKEELVGERDVNFVFAPMEGARRVDVRIYWKTEAFGTVSGSASAGGSAGQLQLWSHF